MNVGATNPMADLYRRLGVVGLSKSQVKRFILPDWWDDEVATNPAGHAEGISYLSRYLGLELASLREPGSPVAFRDSGVCKFKRSKNTTLEQFDLARSMGTRVAHLVSAATAEPCLPPPKTAAQMRSEILGRGHPWVNLANLVDYCWSLGVPVVHLASILEARRPDGLAVRARGRPVVVLCKRRLRPAWLLFILAHELGHVVLGHIPEDGVLIDSDLDHNEPDAEETEANEFAVELLTGDKKCGFLAPGRWPNAAELAEWANEMGRERQISPGHVVLNYAHTMGVGFYPVANAALALLEPRRDALEIVRRKLADHLDWSRLPEESSEFLMRVSQSENQRDLSLG